MSVPEKFRFLTIFHYHLLPGGVTDVIILSTRAILSLMKEIEGVTIVYGRSENSSEVKAKILKGLDEDAQTRLTMTCLPSINYSEKVAFPIKADELEHTLKERFGGPDNLWIIHNYQLGKNPVFTQSLLNISDDINQSLLFQIHDFPECSRYGNLRKLRDGVSRQVYPQQENIAYAVINSRDRNYLIDCGIEEKNVYLLNNPVPLGATAKTDPAAVKKALYKRYSSEFPAMTEEGKLLFYPVRSIRRKNVFEAAFLVKLLKQDVNFFISLPGVSETEKPYSELVKKAFKEGLIPGMWGIGKEEETELINYNNFWAASDVIISPSIQEGFGYLYLNALHWEKPLFTRYLDIMEGFKFLFDRTSSYFYQDIPVPLTDEERTKVRTIYAQKLTTLSEFMPQKRKEELLVEMDCLFEDHILCFSYLPPDMQYEMLQKLDRDSQFKEKSAALNKNSLGALEKMLSAEVLNRDREIDKTFGPVNFTATLKSIMTGLSQGQTKIKQDRNIQEELEKIFFSLPYLRLLYGEGK